MGASVLGEFRHRRLWDVLRKDGVRDNNALAERILRLRAIQHLLRRVDEEVSLFMYAPLGLALDVSPDPPPDGGVLGLVVEGPHVVHLGHDRTTRPEGGGPNEIRGTGSDHVPRERRDRFSDGLREDSGRRAQVVVPPARFCQRDTRAARYNFIAITTLRVPV